MNDRPEILWQQIYNRLQWVDGEDKDGSVSEVIAPVFERQTSPGGKPWFHNPCRIRESEAFLMIFKGHTETVYSCAFHPSGRYIVSASVDQTLRLILMYQARR